MYLVFIVEILCYFYFALISSEVMEWLLYIVCLWITGYYCWKYIFEPIKSYRMVYVFMSNVIISFVLICRLLDIFLKNL